LQYNSGSSYELRKINLDVKDQDYLDFLSNCIEEELLVEEKLKNIIHYHLITYRNGAKMRHRKQCGISETDNIFYKLFVVLLCIVIVSANNTLQRATP